LSSCFFFLMSPRPPSSTLFPYTTLFRSSWVPGSIFAIGNRFTETIDAIDGLQGALQARNGVLSAKYSSLSSAWLGPEEASVSVRSEEHTSELQSLTNLVCRLLLEKKKTL